MTKKRANSSDTPPAPASPLVGIYARTSTADQDPGMQTESLRLEAGRRGWTIFDEYVDKGVSGSKDKRPELDRLIEDVRSGRINIVAVWRFDRFARSTRHLLSALDDFRQRKVEFFSQMEAVQTSSPLGQAMFTIIAAISELERSLIRERVQEGVRRARKRRTTWGRPQKWTEEQLATARRLRAAGKSWRVTSMAVGLKVRTLRRALERSGRRGENQD